MMYQSKLVIFVIYLYPRYIRRKIALQGVKISNLFHTDPRCGKSGGHLNVIKMCHGIDILEETKNIVYSNHIGNYLLICIT